MPDVTLTMIATMREFKDPMIDVEMDADSAFVPRVWSVWLVAVMAFGFIGVPLRAGL